MMTSFLRLLVAILVFVPISLAAALYLIGKTLLRVAKNSKKETTASLAKPTPPQNGASGIVTPMEKAGDVETSKADDVHVWLDKQMAWIESHPEPLTLSVVKLTPSANNTVTDSWLRGPAKFPEHIGWPRHNEKDMIFIGQFCLDGLPQDLWYGNGPRQGWMLVFFSLDVDVSGKIHARVIHITETGPERHGPRAVDAEWCYPSQDQTPVWPDTVPYYIEPRILSLVRESAEAGWPKYSTRQDASESVFLGPERSVGAGYPLLDGYDVPLIQLPGNHKFGWHWGDLLVSYVCIESEALKTSNFEKVAHYIEP